MGGYLPHIVLWRVSPSPLVFFSIVLLMKCVLSIVARSVRHTDARSFFFSFFYWPSHFNDALFIASSLISRERQLCLEMSKIIDKLQINCQAANEEKIRLHAENAALNKELSRFRHLEQLRATSFQNQSSETGMAANQTPVGRRKGLCTLVTNQGISRKTAHKDSRMVEEKDMGESV